MSNNDSSTNTAIVALIVVGLVIAVGAFLYFQNGKSTTEVVHTNTVIEKKEAAPAAEKEEPEKDAGFSFKYNDSDGNTTEMQTD